MTKDVLILALVLCFLWLDGFKALLAALGVSPARVPAWIVVYCLVAGLYLLYAAGYIPLHGA